MNTLDKSILENLDKLGIYELRELARKSGVYSPTTKKSKELKQEIFDLATGKATVVQNKSKKGRPPKSRLFNKDKIETALIPKEIMQYINELKEEESEEDEMLKKIVFHKNIKIPVLGKDEITNIGYIRKSKSGYKYFWDESKNKFKKDILIYVPETISKILSLREGDRVECNCNVYKNKKYGIVNFVIKVNNMLQSNCDKRKSPIEIENAIMPKKEFNLFDEKSYLGGRILVGFKDYAKCAINTLYEAQNLSKEANVVYLGIELAPEISTYLKDVKNVDKFTTNVGETLDISYNVIINAMNYAKTILKENKNVIFIAHDIINTLNVLNLYFSKNGVSLNQHSAEAIQMIKVMFGLGKCINETATLTTIFTMLDSELESDFVKKELLRVASCSIVKD